MKNELKVSFPQLGLVAATRGAIGLGAGLLLANKLSRETRKTIGLPLFAAGVLSTIPIAIHLFHGKETKDEEENETEH